MRQTPFAFGKPRTVRAAVIGAAIALLTSIGGCTAAELYEVRAALRMVERDIRSIQSMGGIITELSPSTRNAIVAALKGPEARGGTDGG